MDLFWQEYLFYIVAIFAILVGISTSSLFFAVGKFERRSRTIWRSVGFFFLVLAFLVFIFERKFSVLGTLGLILELIGFFGIYKGVLSQPGLSRLRDIKKAGAKSLNRKKLTKRSKSSNFSQLVNDNKYLIIFVGFVVIFLVIVAIFFKDYLQSALSLSIVFFISTTIFEQIKRYRREKKLSSLDRRHNLYPLIGYVFLFVSGLFLILYRLPELELVFFRKLSLSYSYVWQLSIFFTFVGFVFLAIWAWAFIKIRAFLRVYIVLLFIAVLVSSLGSLVFTTLVFNIVENNNLDLMTRGTQSVQVVLSDKSNNALLVSRIMAEDDDFNFYLQNQDTESLSDLVEEYMTSSGVDIVRVFNSSSEVLVSPSDERDEGRIFYDDSFLAYTLLERRHIVTFDTTPGVLADVTIVRAIYPVIKNNSVIGSVEVGYELDNAFVDFISKKTGLDATVYSTDTRSATTLTTLDGVSRWVGSKESERKVVRNVLEDGDTYSSIVNRLGQIYYSAFQPVRDINGKIIGMISVGTPTNILFENTRQQLINTFLIVTFISLIVAFIGYLVIRSFRSISTAILLLFSKMNLKSKK